MASERRAQVVRLAEILDVEFEPSIGTAELMEMCVTEAECLRSGEVESEDDETEADEPPAGMRPALRSLPRPVAPAPAQTKASTRAATERSSKPKHRAGGNGARKLQKVAERFESERAQRFEPKPQEGSIRASNGAILHAAGVVPPVRHGFSYGTRDGGRILQIPEGVSLEEAHAAVGLPPPKRRSAVDVDGDADELADAEGGEDGSEDAQEDAQEEQEQPEEVAPVVAHSRRGQRRGGTRKAS